MGLVLGLSLAIMRRAWTLPSRALRTWSGSWALPTLAVIPLARSSWLKMVGDRAQTQNHAVESIVLRQPTSSLAESYHTLRTAILLSTAPRPPQALLVTSAQPGEGKTCTSLNLAMGLAQRGVPVVLVDADMRRPGISRALAFPQNGAGLSSVLSGAHTLDESLRQFEAVPNLWVLPAGPQAPNPADLLSSPTMQKVLEDLRGRFEHVVLDSAPLLLVTDATILSGMVDGVVLVVESGVMARRGLLRAHKILESSGGRILGWSSISGMHEAKATTPTTVRTIAATTARIMTAINAKGELRSHKNSAAGIKKQKTISPHAPEATSHRCGDDISVIGRSPRVEGGR